MNKRMSVVMKKTTGSNREEMMGVSLEWEVRECFYKEVTFELKHPIDIPPSFI